ncbi:MAG: recombinase family protein [Methylococcales bacterium]|nr:recombinase family protein [Methylococcales bacterium]
MNYGYMRVSTDKQDADNQRGAILEYANKQGLQNIEFISEVISSRKADRAIFQLIDGLRPNDNLIIFELSRLGRSMSELESIRVKVAEKGCTIHAISQNLTIKPNGSDISTQALIFALSISAQIERQMISDRTKSALQARKAKGLPIGRPAGQSKLDAHEAEIKGYLAKDLNLTAISKLIDCNRQTLANWLESKGIIK